MSGNTRYHLHEANIQTRRQCIALYNWLICQYATTQQIPSRREMQAYLKCYALCSVTNYIYVLKSWGWIKQEFNTARSITFTRPTEAGLQPDELAALISRGKKL